MSGHFFCKKKDFLAKSNTLLPPYSIDLASCHFWLFLKLKTTLKEARFQSCNNIMEKMTVEIRSIPEDEFKSCFQKWQRRWEKCVHLQGKYFEGDQIKLVIFIVLWFMPKGRILFGQTSLVDQDKCLIKIIMQCKSLSPSIPTTNQ